MKQRNSVNVFVVDTQIGHLWWKQQISGRFYKLDDCWYQVTFPVSGPDVEFDFAVCNARVIDFLEKHANETAKEEQTLKHFGQAVLL